MPRNAATPPSAGEVFFFAVAPVVRWNRTKQSQPPRRRPPSIAFFWQRQSASVQSPWRSIVRILTDGRTDGAKLLPVSYSCWHAARASRRRTRPRTNAEREGLFRYFHNLIDNDRSGGWIMDGSRVEFGLAYPEEGEEDIHTQME